MNEISREDSEIERLLRRAKLPEPSAEIKERVTSAARKAWDQAAADIPWQVPIRRLVVSAAAAVLVISLANYYGDHAFAGRQPREFVAAVVETPDLADWLEMPSRLLARHLSTRPSVYDPAMLHEYRKKVRQILDECASQEPPDAGAPVEFESRLLPARLNFYS